MTGTALASNQIKQRLDQALEHFAARVREHVPSLHYTIQHGHNDNFPWWLVARFVNGMKTDKAVDVSIDCQGTHQEWSIQADIAHEDGTVLRELAPIQHAPSANGDQEDEQMERTVTQVEAFLIQQIHCVIRELT